MSIVKRRQSARIVRRNLPPGRCAASTHLDELRQSTPRREVLAVGGGGAAGAVSLGCGAQFEAEHGQGAGAMADHGFGKEDFAEARYVNGVAAGLYAGRLGLDAAALDERAEKLAVAFLIGQEQAGLQRVGSDFLEPVVRLESRLGLLIRLDVFKERKIEFD